MKISSRSSAQNGSALLTVIIVTFCIGVVLAGYLGMVSAQYRSTMRSQLWNSTMPAVEAGVEDALAHLTKSCNPSGINGAPAPESDGWTQRSGTTIYEKHQVIDTDRLGGTTYYNVSIDLSNAYAPVITAHGYVPPIFSSAKSKSMFATVSPSVTTTTAPMKRTVKVYASTSAYASFGMVSKGGIQMNGNGVSVDSFDSESQLYSVDGHWDSTGTNWVGGHYDTSVRHDGGEVATVSVDNSLSVGNANIRGTIAVGPEGVISVGSNGSVGDTDWVNNNTTGIQTGHSRNDFNASFPEITLPFTSGSSPDHPFTQVLTNTLYATNITNSITYIPPGPGGNIVTNHITTNTVSYPASGTYLGDVLTNTTLVTNSATITSGASGPFTTNTTATTTNAYPDPGTYLGNITTNSSSTFTYNFPTPGTYTGTVTTNWGATNSASYPTVYLGTVSTNYLTSTNTAAATSVSYPSGNVVAGSITTNSSSVTTATRPVSDYVGAIVTNSVASNSVSYPSSYTGTVTTNTTSTTSVTRPSGGYVGLITTNVVATNSTSYPGSFVAGTLTTNTTPGTTTSTMPAAGAYVAGTVVTNGGNQGNGKGEGNAAITYSYTSINGYNYSVITGYTYNQIASYSYNTITGYTYNHITGYNYTAITGTTDTATGYSYTGVLGYNSDQITSYFYQRITSYNFYSPSYYTYALITDYSILYITTSYSYSTNTYDYAFHDGDYVVSGLSGSILIDGTANIIVTGNVHMSGQDSLTISSTIGTNIVKIYADGSSFDASGNATINNNGSSTNFYLFGTANLTSLGLGGNGSFNGIVYAPDAALSLHGGGNDTVDFIGALTVGSVTMNGHFNFHYDEAIGRHPMPTGFTISKWDENLSPGDEVDLQYNASQAVNTAANTTP
jgi:hypothetical protein